MRGGRRWALVILAVGSLLGSAPGFAQSTDPQTNGSSPSDAVGPRDLQNFSLSGNVTKPADQPSQRPSTPPGAAASSDAAPGAAEPVRGSAATQSRPKPVVEAIIARRPQANSPSNLAKSSAPTVSFPAVQPPSSITSQPPATSPPALAPSASASALPDHGLLLWPWLLAAVILAAAAAFLFWRSRQRHAFAGGLEPDYFAASGPHPIPADPPVLPRAVSPPSKPIRTSTARPPEVPVGGGLVSSRLRPWIEVAVQPLRCIVEDHRVTVEFELELFNSGNAPARAVLAEAAIFNAGSTQDEEIGGFIERPVGAGERLDAIAPLQRISLRSQVVAPRESVQVFEIGGRHVFVPLVAFNALYRWSGGEGQSSVSYLLGRETKSDKLAPFRVDLGPRVFRGLGARALPLGART